LIALVESPLLFLSRNKWKRNNPCGLPGRPHKMEPMRKVKLSEIVINQDPNQRKMVAKGM